MNTIIKILVLFTSAFYIVQCCWRSNVVNIIECMSLSEINVEGNDTWDNLMIYNENRKLHLKKNAFRRTPNLVKLRIKFFDGIENGTFNGLSVLDELKLYQYKQNEFPVGILDNLPIRKLTMNDMDMTHILPGFFSNLPELEVFNMYRSNVSEIKKGIFDGTKITNLFLCDSKINYIEPKAFENMNQLVRLNLRGNKLTSFNSKEIFKRCESLNRLWLDKNKIKRIEKNSFSAIPYLRKLNLDLNDIIFIENEAFDSTPNLDFLDLSNNKLTKLQFEIFPSNYLPKLTVLHLHNNKLTFLNKSVFLRLPILQYISIGGNPLQCICLNYIYSWMEQRNITSICDNEYGMGKRPVCINNDNYPNECIYDIDLTKGLYQSYSEIIQQYPNIPEKCDTTKGARYAFLTNY